MHCANCQKEGEIELKYLGKSLCRRCFLKVIEHRISRTIKQGKLIEKTDKIAIAISGGKDSISLLHFLHKYCSLTKIPLIAIYIDRGDIYSKESIEMCKKNCQKLQVPLHIFSFREQWEISMEDLSKIANKIGTNKCSVCGVFRRRLLDAKARELGCNKLATGHNLTDEAQTYLMNFAKGELDEFYNLGSKSLPKRNGFAQRIKPLHNVPNNEMKIYADLKGYEYYPKPCPCRTGSLRFNFMNYLEDIKQSRAGAEFAIVRFGDQIAELLRTRSSGQPKKCKNCGELCSGEICRVCQYLKLK